MKSYLTTLGRRVFAAVITLAIAAAAAPVVLAAEGDPLPITGGTISAPGTYTLTGSGNTINVTVPGVTLTGTNSGAEITCDNNVTGLKLSGAEAGMLTFGEGSTLNITGDNKLEQLITSSNLTIAGEGTLNVDATATAQGGTAVSVTGTLTVETGKLTATGGKSTGRNVNSYGVYATAGLTVKEGGKLEAIGGESNDAESYGAYVGGTVTVSGAMTAEGGKTKNSNIKNSCGVRTTGDLLVTATGALTAKGGNPLAGSSFGVHANNAVTVSGTVTATGGEATGNSYGVRAGTVTVSIGKLTATGGTTGGTTGTPESYGVNASSTVTVNSGTLEATGGTATNKNAKSCGVSAITVTVSDGILTAVGDEATGENATSYGVYTDKGSSGSSGVSVSGGKLTAKGGAIIDGGTAAISSGVRINGGVVTVTNGTLETTGGSGTISSGVFASGGAVTVSGGKLDATGGSSANSSGVYLKGSDASIAFNGGTLLTKGSTAAASNNTASKPTITIGNALTSYGVRTHTEPTDPGGEATSQTGASFTVPDCKFMELTSTQSNIFDLSKFGNAVSITKDGAVVTGSNPNAVITCTDAVTSLTLRGVTAESLKFNGSSTLTLEGTSSLGQQMSSTSNLTIKGEGTLNVNTEKVAQTGIRIWGDLTVSGGKVTATGGAMGASDASYGVMVDGNVTVNDNGTLIATGDTSTTNASSVGVSGAVNGTVTVKDNGTLIATGGKSHESSASSGVFSTNVIVEGGTLTATGGTGSRNTGANSGILLSSNGRITVSGGTLEADGGNDANSFGVTAISEGTIVFSGGTLLAKGNTSAIEKTPITVSNLSIHYIRTNTAPTPLPGEAEESTALSYPVANSIKFLGLYKEKPAAIDDDPTPPAPPTPSEPSTPSIPPVVVPADTASGSTTGAKIEMQASQLPSGVEASDVTFVAKAVEAATAPAQVVSAPAKFAAATLASIPNLPTAKSITVYDLDLLLKSSGKKVDFTGKVTVSIPMPAGYGSFLRVFHVANDGTMTEVPAVISGSNILLTLEHFSHYAVVDFASPAGKLPASLTASAAVTTAATTAKPSEGGNAASNPKTGAGTIPELLVVLPLSGIAAILLRRRKAD